MKIFEYELINHAFSYLSHYTTVRASLIASLDASEKLIEKLQRNIMTNTIFLFVLNVSFFNISTVVYSYRHSVKFHEKFAT